MDDWRLHEVYDGMCRRDWVAGCPLLYRNTGQCQGSNSRSHPQRDGILDPSVGRVWVGVIAVRIVIETWHGVLLSVIPLMTALHIWHIPTHDISGIKVGDHGGTWTRSWNWIGHFYCSITDIITIWNERCGVYWRWEIKSYSVFRRSIWNFK